MNRLDARDLETRHFDQSQLDALFAAILINDVADSETPLPGQVPIDWNQGFLIDAYRLSRQLWIDGVDRTALIGLIQRLARDRDLSEPDRLAFKYARAKYKHVRFLHALIDRKHVYPTMLDWTTTALGHLQDAFKTGLHAKVWREAQLNLLLLGTGPQALLRREIDRLNPATPANFHGYTLRQINDLRAILARGRVTGAQFHAARKIASRRIAFYTCALILRPDENLFRTTRLWAAINGLMGSMHDTLIARRVAGAQDYYRAHFPWPDALRDRLSMTLSLYPES